MDGYEHVRGQLAGQTDAGDRVFLLVAPQASKLPRIVVQRISEVPEHTVDGATDLPASSWQVAVWALTAAQADRAARQVRSRLEEGSVAMFCASISDGYEDPVQGGEERLYRVLMEFDARVPEEQEV